MSYNPEKPYKDKVLKLIEDTWNTPYVSVQKGVYPVLKKKIRYLEIDHTDGIGTKGIYHWRARTFKNAVLDALAMNLNDLAMARAVPYKLQCHIILPKDDGEAIMDIMKNLTRECKKRNIAITGGETSIQNNIYGMDISLTVSGFLKRKIRNKFQEGDVLLGIASNGIHSNGFTAVREAFGTSQLSAFIEPTRIYADIISAWDKKYNIHGMMHITGGAYTKLKGVMGDVDIEIFNSHRLKPQQIFKKIYHNGISDRDMYKMFNCGIGYILSVPERQAKKIVAKTKDADIVGKVLPGRNRINISSMFSDKKLIF